MSKKEFNLSDKIWSEHEIKVKLADDVISVSNVKEFIKRLKIDFKEYLNISKGINDVDYIIDKLAGDKLK